MKRISIINIFLLAATLVQVGCKKNVINYGETETLKPEQALLKINYVSGYAANPSVQLGINGQRVSNLITSRTPFPGGGYNTGGGSTSDYMALTPGNIEVKVSIPNKGTNTDSIMLYKTNITLEAGKNYTVHITDTAANTKTVLAVDDFAMPDSGIARYKFVNLMPNVTALDLYFGTSATTATLVAGNVPYLGTSNYFNLQIPTSASTWYVRETGTGATGTVLASYPSASTYTNRRVYTAFALGYKGLTDAARKPYISFLLNR